MKLRTYEFIKLMFLPSGYERWMQELWGLFLDRSLILDSSKLQPNNVRLSHYFEHSMYPSDCVGAEMGIQTERWC